VLPFLGPYNASKHALEALADNYRVELATLGIDSVIVQPGAFPTSFHESVLRASDTARAQGYGDYANAPARMMESFVENLSNNPQQDPQLVADAVAKLVDTPAGQRPFRTMVDLLGMSDAIGPLNEGSEQAVAAIYNAFGMADMLKLKTN
jgi:NAD(P)-dependent dehydrogenase (short-subunit alcohol dehydrogenase family)